MPQHPVEWWDNDIVNAEAGAFSKRHGELIGLPERDVRLRLGEPDRIASGMKQGDFFGVSVGGGIRRLPKQGPV
jgi:hypothetical protein